VLVFFVGVSALSKDEAVPKEKELEDSLHRIREQPAEILMVKLADRITNLQPPPQDVVWLLRGT